MLLTYTSDRLSVLFPTFTSNTAFWYLISNEELGTSEMTKDGTIGVSIKLKNSVEYDGEEVVQPYIRDMVASTTKPIKKLKIFQKIFLKAGEEKECCVYPYRK